MADKSFFLHVKQLHDAGLSSSLTTLMSLGITVDKNTPDLFTLQGRYQSLVYYGDALMETKAYRKAESIYEEALQLRKGSAKLKGKAQATLFGSECTSDIDVKYKIYQCRMKRGETQLALLMLESIAAKQRTPKVNMALGQMNQQNGYERSAITCYKEVLKECPLALDAAIGLLQLGVKVNEVLALVQAGGNIEWLTQWIRANGALHSRNLSTAVNLFQQLDANSPLSRNAGVVASIGEALYYQGDYTNARLTLDKARSLDSFETRCMSVYAALLHKGRHNQELETLATQLLQVNRHVADTWVALGYHCWAQKNFLRASYMCQKACLVQPKNFEALLLKGLLLVRMKRLMEATTQFADAIKIAYYRFEPHKGVVDCYLQMHRNLEAQAFATNACKQLGNEPRTLTLCALVLSKNPTNYEKAKNYLDKVLKMDPMFLPAVYLLAEIYDQTKNYKAGVDLLLSKVERQSTARLHQMLGDFYTKLPKKERALYHYELALSLDPDNPCVRRGIENIEQRSGGGNGSTTPSSGPSTGAGATHPTTSGNVPSGGGGATGATSMDTPLAPAMEVEYIADSDGNEQDESEVETFWSDG